MKKQCWRQSAVLGLFLLASLTSATTAQTPEDPAVASVSGLTDGFFNNLQKADANIKEEFNELLAGGPLGERNRGEGGDAKVDKMVESYNSLAKYGAFIQQERIGVKRVGDDLIFLKYLYKAENYPIVWYFTYYRPVATDLPGEGWKLIALRFDTRLDLLDLATQTPSTPRVP